MLPSPRWPNGSGRAPGMSLITAASASRDEGRHVRDRHRDVVLDRAADLALHLAEHFADAPEGLRLIEVVGDRGVRDEAALDALGQDRLHRVAQARRAPARTVRSARTRDASSFSGSRAPASYFSTASMPSRTISSNDVTSPPLRSLAMPSSSSAASGEATPTNAVSTERGRGISRKRRGRDDAERAFGADEQVLQIVAGVVLLQLVQIVQHAPVGEHHFEPERLLRARRPTTRPWCRPHWSRDCRRPCRCLREGSSSG